MTTEPLYWPSKCLPVNKLTMVPVSNWWIRGWEWKKTTQSNHSNMQISCSTSSMSLCHSYFTLPVGCIRIEHIFTLAVKKLVFLAVELRHQYRRRGRKTTGRRQWTRKGKSALCTQQGSCTYELIAVVIACTRLAPTLGMKRWGRHKVSH